jgi:diguanylate cyclase (GGDEF)-like protein
VAKVRAWQVWALRPAARVYVVVVVVLDAAVTLTALAAVGRLSLADLGLYIALIGCGAVVIEVIRTVGFPNGTDAHDLLGVWFLPIAVLFPPGYAFLAPLLVGGYSMVRVRRAFPHRRVFSFAAMSLGWGAASIVFHAAPASIAGPAPQSGAHAVAWLALAAGCAVLGWVINAGSVALAIRLATPEVRPRDAFGGRTGGVSDLIELSTAVTATLVVAVAPVALILALPLVLLAQRYLANAQLANQTRVDAQSKVLTAVIWRYEADVEVYHARRTQEPLAVVLATVDDFAGIDDGAGAEAAGRVMRVVAGVLVEELPAVAQVGRLRGGELAAVVPGVDEEEARRLGVRIRDRINGQTVTAKSGDQVETLLRPTVSVGVAGLADSRQRVTDLIAAADMALAKARTNGGNQVTVAPAGPGDHADSIVMTETARTPSRRRAG